MKRNVLLPAVVLASIPFSLPPVPAHAIARSFVSGTGSNANPCTAAAPCQTFAGAYAVTDAGGEISCLDTGHFGEATTLVIAKSITIDCAGSIGSSASNTVGFSINASGIVVRLRNLTLNGNGTATTAILFLNGSALYVESCLINGYNGGAVGEGIGIKFSPPAGVTAELFVKDSVVSNSGRTNDGGGIVIQPTGTGNARVVIENTRVLNNTYGIFANGTGGTGTISVHVRDSAVAGSKFSGISSFTQNGAAIASTTVDRSSSLQNGQDGILSQGSGAFVILSDSTVMGNSTGLNPLAGGAIFSYQQNHLSGNGADGQAPAPLTMK